MENGRLHLGVIGLGTYRTAVYPKTTNTIYGELCSASVMRMIPRIEYLRGKLSHKTSHTSRTHSLSVALAPLYIECRVVVESCVCTFPAVRAVLRFHIYNTRSNTTHASKFAFFLVQRDVRLRMVHKPVGQNGVGEYSARGRTEDSGFHKVWIYDWAIYLG